MRHCLEGLGGGDILMQKHVIKKTVHPPQAFHIMNCSFIQVFGLEPTSGNQPFPANQKPPVQSQAQTGGSKALASEEKDLPLSVPGLP